MTTPAAYLEWAHERAPRDRPLGVTLVRVAGSRRSSSTFTLDRLAALAAAATSTTEPGDVYYRVTLVSRRPEKPGSQGEKRDAAVLTHYAADIDHGGAEGGHAADNLPADADHCARIADAVLPPSAIASSGGGIYAIWRLAAPLDVSTDEGLRNAEHLGRRLNLALAHAAEGLHVDGLAHNMTQIIRPPGTVSYKRAEPRPVTMLRHWDDGPGDVTAEHLDEILPPAARPRRVHERDVRASQAIDMPAVFRADRAHTWYPVRDQGDWAAYNYEGRPGKTYAIKVSRQTGVVVVWSATLAAELDLPQGSPVSALRFVRALAALNTTRKGSA